MKRGGGNFRPSKKKKKGKEGKPATAKIMVL